MFNEKPPADELLAVSDIGKSVTTSLPDNVVSYLCLPLKGRLRIDTYVPKAYLSYVISSRNVNGIINSYS